MAARLDCPSRPTDRRHAAPDEHFTFALRSSHALLTPLDDSDDVNLLPSGRVVATLAAGMAASSLLATNAYAAPRADAPPPVTTAPAPQPPAPQPQQPGAAQRLAGLQALAAAGDTLPQGWSHAEINLILKRVPHTVIYDHGRVLSANGGSVTLREVDGSVVTLPIDAKTIIRSQGSPMSASEIHKGMGATSIRVDGGAAVLLRLHPGRGPAGVQ